MRALLVGVLASCLLLGASDASGRASSRDRRVAPAASTTRLPDAPIFSQAGTPFGAASTPVLPRTPKRSKARAPKLTGRASREMRRAWRKAQAERRRALRTPAGASCSCAVAHRLPPA